MVKVAIKELFTLTFSYYLPYLAKSTVQLLNKLATFNLLKKGVRRHYTATVPPSCLPACQDPPPYPSLLHFATSLQHFKKNEYFD